MKAVNRRTFIKTAAVVGASTLMGGSAFSDLENIHPPLAFGAEGADLSVVTGSNYFQNTIEAVGALGGMETFVSKGTRVGLLVNSPFRHHGAHTSPDIVLAVMRMCYDAGAKAIYYLKEPFAGFWQKTPLAGQFQGAIESLDMPSGDYVDYPLSGGVALKKAEITRELIESDVFINIPITKDHEGCKITGALKNMMGAASQSTCRFFHTGSGNRGWNDDLDHLNQCIADINLVRKPDLCICDATAFIVTNGPFGPGKIRRPQKVVAGTDPVAIDAYCSPFLGHRPRDVGMIQKAVELGLGQMDLNRVRVKEIKT